MEKRLLRIAAGLIAFVMIIPVCSEADDGGSKEYSAILYRIVLRRSMARQDGESGEFVGTEIHIIGMEVYNDAVFVPSGRNGPA